jgi:transcriptional regulator with XRE-family HTH domain
MAKGVLPARDNKRSGQARCLAFFVAFSFGRAMAKRENEIGKTAREKSRRSSGEAGSGENNLRSLDKARLGRILKFLRRAKGLTQKQLAEKIGSTENYVFMYETNRSGIGWAMLNKIGDVLGIPSSWILFIASPDEAPGVPEEVNRKIRDTKNSLLRLIHAEPLTMDALNQAMKGAGTDGQELLT